MPSLFRKYSVHTFRSPRLSRAKFMVKPSNDEKYGITSSTGNVILYCPPCPQTIFGNNKSEKPLLSTGRKLKKPEPLKREARLKFKQTSKRKRTYPRHAISSTVVLKSPSTSRLTDHRIHPIQKLKPREIIVRCVDGRPVFNGKRRQMCIRGQIACGSQRFDDPLENIPMPLSRRHDANGRNIQPFLNNRHRRFR